MNFEELNVKPEIVKALHEIGIKEPTDIQLKAIPIIKNNKDVIGMSKTGSGKTAAFGIPILEKIEPGKGPQILIMAPVRELAVQIAEELMKFGKYLNIKAATVYGGVALDPQITAMERSEIIVCTPGRMLDHLQRGNINLSTLKVVVLDEADKMVDMGFIEDVDKILQATPEQKQVLLFGATLSHEIERLKARHMHDPETAKAEANVKDEYLEQYYYNVKVHEKFSMLVHLLKTEKIKSTIIFCAKRTTVEVVTKNLLKQGIRAEGIHGKMSQNRRLSVIKNFKLGKPKILVASAVAARGLDISGVSHVINYDLSQDPQEYIHRVGRTARAGDSGKAFTLLSDYDFDAMSAILRNYDVKIKCLPPVNFKKLSFDAGQRRNTGRFGGNRYTSRGPSRNSGPRNGGYNRGPRRESSGSDYHGNATEGGSKIKNWRDAI